jgi:hypothetical protein
MPPRPRSGSSRPPSRRRSGLPGRGTASTPPRLVTVLLSADAVPHRDVYDLAKGWCTQSLEVIYDAVGRELVRRYSPGHVAGEPLARQLAAAGQTELGLAADADIDRIAAAMVTLAAALEELLDGIAGDEAALPGLRDAARAAGAAARLIWSHYGGDSGGW